MLTALFLSAALAQDEGRLAACAGCHGPDGNSRTTGVPSIAGQPKVFLENYLVLTREGLRGSEVMQKLLHGVPDREIVVLAAHFSMLPMKPEDGGTDAARFERGREVVNKSHCANCHRPDFRGQEQMPRLAGQREDFLIEAMLAYRQDRRPGGDTIMAASLYGIPEDDLRAIAHYLARLR
ncbi:MAG TPA: c-type cytochrome [Burkholderiales bacterium]|nr:c-type cytochrome [Burkholderiales bacterium]